MSILVLGSHSQVFSQPARLPQGSTLEDAQRKAAGTSSQAVDAASRQLQGGAAGAAVGKPTGMPSIATPTAGGIDAGVDPEKVFKQFQQLKQGIEQTPERQEGFIVFISLSMPRSTLDRIIEQSLKLKFTMVLRGLEGDSMTGTIKKIQGLIGQRNADIQIDPRLFDRFGISRVPAVVLLSPDTQASGVVFGDVSVDYALEHMTRAMPSVATYAQRLLDRGFSKERP